MNEQPFIWNNEPLPTYSDISDVMNSIYRIWQQDPDTGEVEARRFMREYRAFSPHADANVGYLTGYYGADEMRALQELFDVAHPVFGRSVPSPEEAVAAGARLMRDSEGAA